MPTDVKLAATEGKSLITETHKATATSQPPLTVEGLTVVSSGKVDPQEPKQQAPRETTAQKQHPSPDMAGLRVHSGDKETIPLAITAPSQDDSSSGNKKKFVASEEKSTSVGSHMEDPSLPISQNEERHPTVTTLPETVSVLIPW